MNNTLIHGYSPEPSRFGGKRVWFEVFRNDIDINLRQMKKYKKEQFLKMGLKITEIDEMNTEIMNSKVL